MQYMKCPVCLGFFDLDAVWPSHKVPCRDHAHEDELNPGEFRGYLCLLCNMYLNSFAEGTPKGTRAREYLALADTHYWHNIMLKVQSELKG